MNHEAVESVRDRGAGHTTRRVIWPKHVVVNEKLRASSEQLCQGRFSLLGLEYILLVDSNPRQLLPLPRQLVAPPRMFLLCLEQLHSRSEPLFTCSSFMFGHLFLLSLRLSLFLGFRVAVGRGIPQHRHHGSLFFSLRPFRFNDSTI